MIYFAKFTFQPIPLNDSILGSQTPKICHPRNLSFDGSNSTQRNFVLAGKFFSSSVNQEVTEIFMYISAIFKDVLRGIKVNQGE